MLGLLTSIATAAGAGAVGGMMLTRKGQHIPKLTKPTLIAGGLAGGFCALYLVRLLTATMDFKPGISWAAFVGLGGLIAAGALIQRVQKMTAFSGQFATAPAGGAFAGPPGGNPYAGPPGGAPMGGPPMGGPPMGAPGAAPPAAAAPAPATHPCPRCQKPLVFVAQYQRWFCESCKQYA
jgi:hypothetical protein